MGNTCVTNAKSSSGKCPVSGKQQKKTAAAANEDIDALTDDFPPITDDDFSQASQNTRPTVSVDVIKKHEDWQLKFGSS